MSDGLKQEVNFDEDDYARPNQPFRCGWADEGRACPLGPTQWGLCRAARECAPYKEGDTWQCARTKASGGPCEDGPLPDGTCCSTIQSCQPVRNVLSRRGLVSLCVFALALGAGFIMLGTRTRSDLASPGELSPRHRQVAHHCQDCHVAGDGKLSDWIHASLDGESAQQQSQLCLKCHGDLGEHAMQPHGSSSDLLDSITSAAEADEDRRASDLYVRVAKSVFGPPPGAHAVLACATCHKEHHGDASLTELTSHQCQVCHAGSFHSFAQGHPEFDNYVRQRRTRIYFDHASHYGQHFGPSSQAGAESQGHACNDCHVADTSGRAMLLRDFDQSCAKCHQPQIEDDSLPGLAVMALPAIDVATLQEKQIDIGEWPESYPLHVEAPGQFTPVSKLLMLAAEGFSATQVAAGDLDLSDLSAASDEQLQAIGRLVWIFKEMLHDVAAGGHPELQRRLTTALAGSVSETQAAALAHDIPVQLLGDMQRLWLPNLAAEVQARREGGELEPRTAPPIPDPAQALAAERAQLASVRSGWYLHPSSLALRYRSSRHADILLKTLLDVSATASPIATGPIASVASHALRGVYHELASPFAAGRCTKCHSVDSIEFRKQVNWRSYTPPHDRRDFTRFSHALHVAMLQDEACATCHEFSSTQIAADSLYRPEFHHSNWTPATDASVFESNFAPLLKASCVECHAEPTRRDSCLTCHNYHVR